MSPILVAGTAIVHLALACYTVGILLEQRARKVSPRALGFLTSGVVFDVVATVCMIVGSSRGPFTLHGLLGFSSLTAMVVETSLAWRHRLAHGDREVSRGLHLYSRLAYFWWVAAYVTGAALVMMARG